MAEGFPKDDQGRLLPLGDGDLRAGKYNMQLLRKAIERSERKPDPKTFELIEKQMLDIVAHGTTERNQIAAGKLLATLLKLDMEADKLAADILHGPTPAVNINVNDPDRKCDSILEVAAQLGLDPSVVEAAEESADIDSEEDTGPAGSR